MKTCNAILGSTTNVAMTNCHSATVWMDCGLMGPQLSHARVHHILLTANNEFAYTHGGNGEARMSMIRGSPFASCAHSKQRESSC